MREFIEECLKPLYVFQWLKTIPFDEQLYNSIAFYVAYTDKRLLNI